MELKDEDLLGEGIEMADGLNRTIGRQTWRGLVQAGFSVVFLFLGLLNVELSAQLLETGVPLVAENRLSTIGEPTSAVSGNPDTAGRIQQSDETNWLGMRFVEIRAGRFRMGSDGGDSDEWPFHWVEITGPFQIQATEVTQRQWEAVMGDNPSYFKNCGLDCPVEGISWEDAQEFIRRLNAHGDGWTYRLPTEAEWEYACRAGTTEEYAGRLAAMGWYDANSGGRTHPVAEKQPNPWGLFDMHGSVWEWCHDWHGGAYYKNSPTKDPQGPPSGSYRVSRGGSWNHDSKHCRSSFRLRLVPGVRDYDLGLRVLRTR